MMLAICDYCCQVKDESRSCRVSYCKRVCTEITADDNDCIRISIAKSGVASLLEFMCIVCLSISTVLFVLLPFQRACQSPFWTVLLPMQGTI